MRICEEKCVNAKYPKKRGLIFVMENMFYLLIMFYLFIKILFINLVFCDDMLL